MMRWRKTMSEVDEKGEYLEKGQGKDYNLQKKDNGWTRRKIKYGKLLIEELGSKN